MCTVNTSYTDRRETKQERRSRLICDIGNGQSKVKAHAERLRLENPRLHAALLPLLTDLDQWMSSVDMAISGLSYDMLSVENGR